MKILFYLPTVTPWWFETLITPMVQGLHAQADIHIMVAPIWNNTGIQQEHAQALADLPRVHWHIVQPDEPALFRRAGASLPGLIDTVAAIAPDLTLARAVDCETCDLFPGTVRYLMEGTATPFSAPPSWLVLKERPLSHGFMPERAAARADQCAEALTEAWDALEERITAPLRGDWRGRLGLPHDRPILAVPLQYEHVEEMYRESSPFADGALLIETLLAHLDERIFLAVTDHPLNERFLKRDHIKALIGANSHRAAFCRAEEEQRGATGLLAAGADAMMIDQSKCIALAQFFGCPVIRVGKTPMADWIRASNFDDLVPERLAGHALPAPDRDMTRRWFGWHYGMHVFNPTTITLDRLLDYVAGQPDDHAIEDALRAFDKQQQNYLKDIRKPLAVTLS